MWENFEKIWNKYVPIISTQKQIFNDELYSALDGLYSFIGI